MSNSAFSGNVQGIVVPGTSAGLVSQNGLPGNTTGSAIATGYVGEVLLTNPGSAVAIGSSATYTQIVSKTLGAGTWLISGFAQASVTAAGTLSYYSLGISTSGTGFDNYSYVTNLLSGFATTSASQAMPTASRVITTTGQTVYLIAQLGYSGTYTGTYTTSSLIQAIRIA
jgi:hypothetical protein